MGLRTGLWFSFLIAMAGCSSGGDDDDSSPAKNANVGSPGSGGMQMTATAGISGASGTGGHVSPPAGTGGSTTGSGGGAAPINMPTAGSGGGGVPSGSGGMTGSGGAPSKPTTPAGPDDGDASKPVVAIDGVPCRAAGGGGFGFPMANLKVDDRDVILDYPCDKHEGAPMTFILNLHGTTPVAQHFYQEGYFSAYQFVSSHNLIIATPSAVGEQWGNGDDGKDEPYLMDVIDYVYKNFAGFDIRSMWVGGHSWGGFYTAQFGCKPELADKVQGLIIMSGSPTLAACADKMAMIDTNAEMDIGPPLDQGMLPMKHGCDASMMMMVGNNTETFWPNCDTGFVHANYLMLGKMHTDSMDKEVVQSIVDWIKMQRH